MPLSAPSRCPEPGCTRLVRPSGPSSEHRRDREVERGTSAERGYDRRHRRWRLHVLAADPVCHYPDDDSLGATETLGTAQGFVVIAAKPGAKVCRREARIADHAIPMLAGGARFDLSNGQGLCEACHNRKTALEKAGVVVWTRRRKKKP